MQVRIAAKKDRPSTCHLITGVPPVTFTAGSPVSADSGMTPAKLHWSGT